MPEPLVATGTEWRRFPVTFTWGDHTDVIEVGVYLTLDPAEVPTVNLFDTATLVDFADYQLGDGEHTYIAALIGARADPQVIDIPEPGQGQEDDPVQVWARIATNDEDILRRVDTLEVLR